MNLAKRDAREGTKIQYMSPELLFLAKSGQPYRGSLYINFISRGETFDLLDLKKYITALRGKILNSEDIAYEIYETINSSVSTDDLGVIVELTARGGIQQTLSYGKEFELVKKKNIFQVAGR